MRIQILLPLLLATVFAGSGALAQDPQQAQGDDGQDIIVQGSPNPKATINRFVKELTPAPIGAQLGRFLEPVCPRVLGLPAGQDALVEARMRRIAAAVGAPVARPKCTVNLYVLVGGDKAEIIDGLKAKFPDLVAGVPDSVLKRLKASPGPVAAWQIVGMVGTDGMPLSSVRTSADGDPVLVSNTIGFASRIARVTRPQFLGSMLVVEAGALNGVDTRQLADYAVMRTLAPTDTTHQAALPANSIIKLFDPGNAPENGPLSVTHWDFAFLKALYSSSNQLEAGQQRGEMTAKMAEELAKLAAQGK
jgi:hypothetical protein